MQTASMLAARIIVLLGGLAASTAAAAQDPLATLRAVLPEKAEIELALSAAPQHLRGAARVMVFGPAGFREVRAGSNGLTCLVNRDALFYGESVFKPTCWDRNGRDSYVPVMLRVGELLAKGADAKAIRDDVDAGFATKRFRSPDRAGVAYMLAGDLELDVATGAIKRQTFPGHYMFYAVGIGNEDLGYSRAGAAATPGLPFVMSQGAGGSRLGYIISGHGGGH